MPDIEGFGNGAPLLEMWRTQDLRLVDQDEDEFSLKCAGGGTEAVGINSSLLTGEGR